MKRAVLLCCSLLSAASAPAVEVVPLEPPPPVSQSAPEREIPSESLLLVRCMRAEAALAQGDRRQARRLVRQIEPWIPEGHVLYNRLKRLQAALSQSTGGAPVEPVDAASPTVVLAGPLNERMPWTRFDPAGRHLLLLPLTGLYGPAGRAMLAVFKRHMPVQPVEVLDTALFTASELKPLIDAYSPDWLLGPLRPEVAAGLDAAGVEQPMLVLASRCPESVSRCWPVAPSLQRTFLSEAAERMQSQGRTLLLADRESWMALPLLLREPLMALAAETVLLEGRRVQDQLKPHLNIDASLGRISWLRAQLKRPVQARPRARQDIDQVIVFGDADQAFQVASLTGYWSVDAEVLWFPDRLPSRRQLLMQLPSWPAVTGWLHPFLLDKSSRYDDFGIFRATAESVAEVFARPTAPARRLPIGWYVPDADGWRLELRPIRIEGGRIRLLNR